MSDEDLDRQDAHAMQDEAGASAHDPIKWTQDDIHRLLRVPPGETLESMAAKESSCAVPECAGPARNGNTHFQDIPISDYCVVHGFRVGIYGQPDLPDYLDDDNDACTWTKPEGQEPKARNLKCREPQVGNQLCLLHINSERGQREAIAAIDSVRNPPSLPVDPVLTDEAMRVLVEIDKIRSRGPSIPRIPLPPGHSVATSFLSMFSGFYPLESCVRLAFWMSPYALGQALSLPPRDVNFHLQALTSRELVEVDPDYRLPDGFLIVVRKRVVTKRMSRAWRRKGFRDKFPARHTKFLLPDNLPKSGEEVLEPTLDGPGTVKPEYQGKPLQLTDTGHVKLRAWMTHLEEKRANERDDRTAKRIGLAALALAIASLVSVAADLPDALETAGRFAEWLTGYLFGDR